MLLWWIEWGPHLAKLRARIEAGKVKAWNERPQLRPELSWVWTAWRALSGSRHLGYGVVGPIPFVAVDTYAQRYSIDGDDFDALAYLLNEMDDAFLSVVNATRQAKGGASG